MTDSVTIGLQVLCYEAGNWLTYDGLEGTEALARIAQLCEEHFAGAANADKVRLSISGSLAVVREQVTTMPSALLSLSASSAGESTPAVVTVMSCDEGLEDGNDRSGYRI